MSATNTATITRAHEDLIASQVRDAEKRFGSSGAASKGKDKGASSGHSSGWRAAVDPQTGKKLPRSATWGYDEPFLWNTRSKSLVFTLVLVGSFLAFNASSIGKGFYRWLTDNYTPFQIDFYWTFGITTALYWVWAAPFIFVDLTGKPDFIFKFKIQPFQHVGAREYGRIALVVLKNQLLVTAPLTWLKATYTPSVASPETLPGPLESLAVIVFNILCTEVGFYYVHRTLHRPGWYQRFHKQHHEYSAPVGLAATYCTAFEHIFSNLLPNVIGTTITQCHWSLTLFTFSLLTMSTIVNHSGYCLPYMSSSVFHDWHHFAFTEAFGPLTILDRLHGTSKGFEKAMADARRKHCGDEAKAHAEILATCAQAEYQAAIDAKKSS